MVDPLLNISKTLRCLLCGQCLVFNAMACSPLLLAQLLPLGGLLPAVAYEELVESMSEESENRSSSSEKEEFARHAGTGRRQSILQRFNTGQRIVVERCNGSENFRWIHGASSINCDAYLRPRRC